MAEIVEIEGHKYLKCILPDRGDEPFLARVSWIVEFCPQSSGTHVRIRDDDGISSGPIVPESSSELLSLLEQHRCLVK